MDNKTIPKNGTKPVVISIVVYYIYFMITLSPPFFTNIILFVKLSSPN